MIIPIEAEKNNKYHLLKTNKTFNKLGTERKFFSLQGVCKNHIAQKSHTTLKTLNVFLLRTGIWSKIAQNYTHTYACI